MANFLDILNKPADTIEKPKPYPIGHYICAVQGPPEYKTIKTKNGEAQKVHYKLKPLATDVDVDQDALRESGGLARPFPDLQFYLGVTDEEILANLHRPKEFVTNVGAYKEGMTARQMLEAPQNHQVKVQLGHRPSEDGTQIYAEVKRTLPV